VFSDASSLEASGLYGSAEAPHFLCAWAEMSSSGTASTEGLPLNRIPSSRTATILMKNNPSAWLTRPAIAGNM